MKLGVLTVVFGQQSLTEALDLAKAHGLEMVELGTGNYPGDAHCNLEKLLKSAEARKRLLEDVGSRGLEISGLACHGNALHPNKALARKFDDTAKKTIRLASLLGVKTVIDFSGCPGDGPNAKYPNWVTCPWPPDFLKILEWQWDDVVIPYWTRQAQFAKDHGVRIAIEMHPGFVVYSPETLMKLRKAAGETVGANLDPSHLFWQGIDPVQSVFYLGPAIHYVHAKDTRIDPANTALCGVLDTKHYGDVRGRSWVFRSCGWGHGREFWTSFASALRVVGYDHVLSIEHEDGLMSPLEGFVKAVEFLKPIVMHETPGEMWWA